MKVLGFNIPYAIIIGATTISVGIFCYLARKLIEHYLTIVRAKQNRANMAFNEAAKEFREAFNDVIINLDMEEHAVARLLYEFFPQHKDAFLKFRPHLKGKALRKLEEGWNEYNQFHEQNHYEDSGIAAIEFLASAKTPHEAVKRKEYMEHINNLLIHAKTR